MSSVCLISAMMLLLEHACLSLVSSVRVGLVLVLWIMILVARTSPVHAQSIEVYAGSSRTYQTANEIVQISVVQGQGQICWTAPEDQDEGPSTTPDCTTSSVLDNFFPGDVVTFTATGMNGYVFDHWITPDRATYTGNPISVSFPMSVMTNPMAAVFVKGTGVPEFSQAFLMLGAAMILSITILRRRNASRRK
jgi:hypothetical protein